MRAPRTRGWRRLHLTFHLLFIGVMLGLLLLAVWTDRAAMNRCARASALRCAIGSICSCGNWILPMATWCWQILSFAPRRASSTHQPRRARASCVQRCPMNILWGDPADLNFQLEGLETSVPAQRWIVRSRPSAILAVICT